MSNKKKKNEEIENLCGAISLINQRIKRFYKLLKLKAPTVLIKNELFLIHDACERLNCSFPKQYQKTAEDKLLQAIMGKDNKELEKRNDDFIENNNQIKPNQECSDELTLSPNDK